MSDVQEYVRRQRLLTSLANVCVEDPSFLSKVIEAGVYALQKEVQKQRDRASDMEIFAISMCRLVRESRVGPKLREEINRLALSRLSNHITECSLNWEPELARAIKEMTK